ncbi:MAG: lipopolysaccharide transport periplasmic protein LptA [Legionellales bacterium]
MRHQLMANLSIYALLCSAISPSYALPSDKEQVMHVVADSADLNQQKHKGVYTGHVAFTQGTTNIQASKAITNASDKNQLTLAIAMGSKENPAHYWTEPEAGKPPFHAYADSILFYPLRHLVELKGHAHIEQGKNSLTAALITYDTLDQHVITQSDGTTKTTILFHPEKKPT